MTLADLSAHAADRLWFDTSIGHGETVTYTPPSSADQSIVVLWLPGSPDAQGAIGVGVVPNAEAALCQIRVADLATVDPAATITRHSTTWYIRRIVREDALVWSLHLTQERPRTLARLRG